MGLTRLQTVRSSCNPVFRDIRRYSTRPLTQKLSYWVMNHQRGWNNGTLTFFRCTRVLFFIVNTSIERHLIVPNIITAFSLFYVWNWALGRIYNRIIIINGCNNRNSGVCSGSSSSEPKFIWLSQTMFFYMTYEALLSYLY